MTRVSRVFQRALNDVHHGEHIPPDGEHDLPRRRHRRPRPLPAHRPHRLRQLHTLLSRRLVSAPPPLVLVRPARRREPPAPSLAHQETVLQTPPSMVCLCPLLSSHYSCLRQARSLRYRRLRRRTSRRARTPLSPAHSLSFSAA